jgi:hypothetical protein
MPTGIYERTKEHNRKISMAMTGVKKTEEHCKNISLGKKGIKLPSGEKHHAWKGGKRILRGYCVLNVNSRMEHRIIMEKLLGRKLSKKEVVHHIDGDKTNNAAENLRLFPTQKDHLSYHAKTRRGK